MYFFCKDNTDQYLPIRMIEIRVRKHLMLTTYYPFYYTGHAPKKFVVIASLGS
jgi:hypothetical protein